MTTPFVPSLIDEMVSELIREHLLPADTTSKLNRDTRIEDLPAPMSATLYNRQWKHEVRHVQSPA